MAHTVDARGLSCPLPYIKAKAALETAAAGEEVVVLATDHYAPVDIGALANDTGCSFAQRRDEGGWFELRLTKPA